MTQNSVILTFISFLYGKLKNWYLSSGYYKIFDKFASWVGRLFSGSMVYALFSGNSRDRDNGIISKAVNGFFGFFYRLFHGVFTRLASKASESVASNLVKFIINEWYKISVRYYSIMLISFILVRLVILQFAGRGIDVYSIIGLMFATVGLLVDVSPAGLYQGWKSRKLVGLEDLSEKTKLTVGIKPYVVATGALVIGAALGLAIAMPYWYIFVGAMLGLIFIFSKPKAATFLLIGLLPFLPTMGAVGLMLCIMLSMFFKYIMGESPDIKADGFDFACLAFCIALIYGVLNSFAVSSSIPIAMVYIVFVSSFFVIRRCASDKNYMYKLIDTIIAAAFFVSLYGIYQYLFVSADTTWQDVEMFESMKGRIYSTFGNPNVFGEYLLMTIPITYARLIMKNPKGRSAAYICSLALQLVCMVLTYSRGCWIGLVAAMGIMLMMTGRKLTSLCVIALFFVPFILPQSIIERVMSIGNTADSSTSYRVFIWEGTMRMLRDFWHTGIGIGTDAFNSVYPAYSLNAVSAPHSHNLYLHIVVEMGIVGVLVFIWVIRNFFKSLANASKKLPELKPLCCAIGLGILGYLIQGMFDNVWYNYRIYFMFFIMMALAAALCDISKKEGKNEKN